jgi:hypothetical protein
MKETNAGRRNTEEMVSQRNGRFMVNPYTLEDRRRLSSKASSSGILNGFSM